jgi:hypothetical protein
MKCRSVKKLFPPPVVKVLVPISGTGLHCEAENPAELGLSGASERQGPGLAPKA